MKVGRGILLIKDHGKLYQVSLKIFKSLGGELETLVDEYKKAGIHSTL